MDIQKPKTQIEGVQLDFSSVKELGERWEKLPKHQKSYSIAGITAGISGLVACAISTGGIALIPVLGTLGAYSVPLIGGLVAGGIAKQGYSDSKPLIPEHKAKYKVKFGDITTTLMTSISLLIGVGFATSGAGLGGVLLSMYESFMLYSTQIALIGIVAICNQGLIKKTVGVDMLAMVNGGINQLAGEIGDKVVEPKKVNAVEPVIDLNMQVKVDELQAKYDQLQDQNLMLELERDELLEQSKLIQELESVEEFTISKPKVKQISQEDKLSIFFDSYSEFTRDNLRKSMPHLGNAGIQNLVNELVSDRKIQVLRNGNYKVLQSI